MIIGISGKKTVGKDTTGKIIQYLTGETAVYPFDLNIDYSHKSNWQIKKFADRLKDIICILINCNRKQLEDESFKSKELGEEWWYWYMELDGGYSPIILDYLTTTKKELKSYEGLELIKPTPRFLLQFIGTNLLRNQLHPEIWVNSLMSEYDKGIQKIEKSAKCNDGRLKHGYNKTRIFRIYHNIKQRCYNKKHPRYNSYGGKNIVMCKEWLESLENFVKWSEENGYNENLTLDRINNDEGYYPENCRWTTYNIQAINQGLRKDNTSGYKGVTKDKHNWRADIQVNYKKKFLGYFSTAEQASEAYEEEFSKRFIEENKPINTNKFIITDLRFPNELEAVKKRGGITIRVNRPCNICGGSGYHKMSCPVSKSGEHYSEIALDSAEFNYVIENSESIEELIEKVRIILVQEKII